MIIDFRIRPPVRSFTSLAIYPPPGQAENSLFGWHGLRPESVQERSMPKLLNEMKNCDVAYGVVWGRAVTDKPEISTTNEDVAATAADCKNVFIPGFGGIGVPRQGGITAALAQVDMAIKKLGLKGVAIEPQIATPIAGADEPRLYPLYQRCQELGGILALTISRGGRKDTNLNYSNPAAVDRVAGDFPDLKIVIAHSCWPWVAESCGLAFRRRNVYLLPDMFGIMPGSALWVEAANTYLEDRLLFGSSYPQLGVGQAVRAYQRMPFGAKVREKVMYANAARLLGL